MEAFDAARQPFQLSRHSVAAQHGMVCSSSALASQAGLDVMKKGGNAIDAAIAAAGVLTSAEPCSNGLGGDAFAIVWHHGKLYGLNGSGKAPAAISIEKVKALGYESMPKRGWIPVMVPGQPKAWAALNKRFGKLSLEEDLQSAIQYARDGLPISASVAHLFEKYVRQDLNQFEDKLEFDGWKRLFTDDGKPFGFGQVVKFPEIANTLETIAKTDSWEFYHGTLADKMDAQSRAQGGFLRKSDLESYDVDWVDPVSINYHGYDVWELPPNGQGIVALAALNILKHFDFSNEKASALDVHRQFEAMKEAFHFGFKSITDPVCTDEAWRACLDEEFGKNKAASLKETAQNPMAQPYGSGTVYLCTADEEGNMVSYIQSNYMDFGSGIVIDGTGISLQNRGYDFSLNPEDVNALRPGKRSYHTIIPGFLTKDGSPVGPFGVMGGYMQPQGHVQVLMNLIDRHLNPQMCLDAPRWQWKHNKTFLVEPQFDLKIVEDLRKRGHDVLVAQDGYSFGRGQMIVRLDNGIYVGATESRTDGSVACW